MSRKIVGATVGTPHNPERIVEKALKTEIFVITLTADENGNYTSDKTGQEIFVAFNAGRRLVCNIGAIHIPLTSRGSIGALKYMFIFRGFSGVDKNKYTNVCITYIPTTKATTVGVSNGEYAEKQTGFLVIDNQIYDGSKNVIVYTGDFVFNATPVGGDSNEVSLNVTAEEFLNAFNAGRTMAMAYEDVRLPFMGVQENLYIFMLSYAYLTVIGVVSIDGDTIFATVDEIDGSITIGEQTGYGDEPIDFTDTINKMIDEKYISTEELASLKIALI